MTDGATGHDLAMALHKSSQTTYRAVMKPVEGTMLTVGRDAARAAEAAAEEGASPAAVLKAAYEAAAKAVQDSPVPTRLERSGSRGCRWSRPALYF